MKTSTHLDAFGGVFKGLSKPPQAVHRENAPTIEDAIIIASNAHRGQADKAGLPYILHPLRVMSMFVLPEDADARIVAVLHDVVEDTDWTLGKLRSRGFSPVVIDAIDAISRRESEGYKAYIQRVSENPQAARVKLADLQDNLDERRKSTKLLTLETIAKYRAALEYLTRALHPLDRMHSQD